MDFEKEKLKTYPNSFLPHAIQLNQLKNRGFTPKVIYDIGAAFLHWTKWAKMIFPDSDYYYFDAWQPLANNYSKNNINTYHIGVLGDVDGKEVEFYERNDIPWGNSYYKERTKTFKHVVPVIRKMMTLDTLVKEYKWPTPDLVKIDVQGAEMDIIKGALNTFKNTKYLIVELQHENYNEGAPKFDETGPWLEHLGWKCIAWRFASGSAFSVDADYLFVNSNIE